MKILSILGALLLIAASALMLSPTLLPAASVAQPYLPAAALALSLIVLVAVLAQRSRPREATVQVAEPARPIAPPPTNQAEAEIVSLLAMLQEKGRLVDFLMDDINPYNDAQVGAAARVVHAGCKSVLKEHFRIGPVRAESEGATVQVPAGYAADEYRLVGKISGQAPFSGVLIHRGWKTDGVTLPRVLRNSADRLPTIAPAEVELK